jgi:Trk-type K+ transport system membrane component
MLIGLHYVSYVFVFVIFGGAIGFAYGGGFSRWRLKILSKNGEYKPKLIGIVLLLIVVILILFASNVVTGLMTPDAGLRLDYELADIAYPAVAALYAAQSILFYHWERIHGKIIVSDGFWSTKLYVFPQIDKMVDIDANRIE